MSSDTCNGIQIYLEDGGVQTLECSLGTSYPRSKGLLSVAIRQTSLATYQLFNLIPGSLEITSLLIGGRLYVYCQ